jgi:RNA polymerase sigma-70 factor (ECF subfamily)
MLIEARIDHDQDLVEALRGREPSAAERLVSTYGDRAYRLAIRITGNALDAEEAVQDAFWIVVRKIDAFRGDSRFGSWLYRIVANAAFQKLRSLRGRHGELSLDELLPPFDEHGRHVRPVIDWSACVDDPSVQSELRRVLTTALDELPADHRTVVELHDVEGLSHQETAELLGITVTSSKTRLHRARLLLRERLAGYLAAGEVVPRRRRVACRLTALGCGRP